MHCRYSLSANALFALFALVTLGTPRSGVLVAVDAAKTPLRLGVLVPAVVVAAAAGTCLVVVLGGRYLRVAGSLDATALVAGVLALLVCLAVAFAGAVGLACFVAAAVVGFVPTVLGGRRVHLMGVLVGPLVLGV